MFVPKIEHSLRFVRTNDIYLTFYVLGRINPDKLNSY